MKIFQQRIVSSIISAIFGGGIVVLLIPTLIHNGVLESGITLNQQQISSEDRESAVNPIQANQMNNTDSTNDKIQSIKNVSKAVVGVINIQNSDIQLKNMDATETGSGSGIVYKKEMGYAYIVTNHHVIAEADRLEVVLNNGTKAKAELVGSDSLTDLAVIKMKDKSEVDIAKLGSSYSLQVGENVLAIGNPLGTAFSSSVTQGIISGLNRSIPIDINQDGQEDWAIEVIQTDAAINPGNSGGALVDLNGEVIGINSMKIARQDVEGIGFSIPISQAKPIISDLENNGQVNRPYIGIGTAALSEIPSYLLEGELRLPSEISTGVIVANVASNSPAQLSGLQKMDVITQLDDQTIANPIDLRNYLYKKKKVGETVTITFYRSGKRKHINLSLVSD